jgi:hypothetical protein
VACVIDLHHFIHILQTTLTHPHSPVQHITMGANVSVSRLSTIGPGQAFNTQIPHGKLSRSAIAALGELGYGQTGYNDEPAVVNFFATASQAEEYHKRAIELPIVVKPCRVTRMIQPTAM